MPRENSKGKRLKRIEKLPIPSFDDEVYVLDNPFEKFSILFGKNVDFASFTFEVPSFHIEEVFIGMGWTSIATLEEHAYPNLIKCFTKIWFPILVWIAFHVYSRANKLKLPKLFYKLYLELAKCENQIFCHIAHPTLEGYNPSMYRVIDKNFEHSTRLCTNQLFLPHKILHDIIAYVILPKKSYHDKVTHSDLFNLDSFCQM